MTTSYYAPVANIRGNMIVLPDEEARHAVKVLRLREGDEIIVVDGEGGWYRARIERAGARQVTASIVETRREVGEPARELTVALALLKNPSRYETFLEKAVELGVSRIVPLVTERTEKGRMKEARAQNILIAAMKQSGRSRIVQLEAPVALDDFLGQAADGLALICHEALDPEQSIRQELESAKDANRITILIGPEGGFSEGELERAALAGYRPVSLGPRRLRAETAALAATAAVLLIS